MNNTTRTMLQRQLDIATAALKQLSQSNDQERPRLQSQAALAIDTAKHLLEGSRA